MRKERKEALESFLVRLGVTMQDLSLMDTALTHSSYAYECKHCCQYPSVPCLPGDG